ncbi:MAG: exo-alpha-sialidase [Proteobacteria bacterium]|nr:exo-alpha-sialidase [Pseudomonadota bacterium]
MHGAHAGPKTCEEPALACATKATPAIGPDGALWLAFAAGGQVLVARSSDLGRTFSSPVSINRAKETLDWGPDSRPKIAIAKNGEVAVTYAIFKDKAFNGEVRFARSIDGGRTFSEPKPITSDPESQRFETATPDADGRLFIAWLDKRNRAVARAKGEKYPGAALAFAWSGADGKLDEAKLARDGTCECCRLAVAFRAPGQPVVLFRNIFEGGIRDHAVITFADPATPGPVRRVAVDDWKTDACPHQGPSLAIARDGAYHAAWFTDGRARHGLFYAFSRDQGASFSSPMRIGSEARAPERPTLLAAGGKIHLAWKEFDGTQTSVMAMARPEGGEGSWSEPRAVGTAANDSDHPLLIAINGAPYLSWLVVGEGYRLVALESTQ